MQPTPYYKRTKKGEARTYLVSKNYVIADILQWWCEAVLVSAKHTMVGESSVAAPLNPNCRW